MPSLPHLLRNDLGGSLPTGPGQPLLSLEHVSDAHVLDAASPARCEWIEPLGADPLWKPLLHMHRPYEAMTHWVLAAHVERLRQNPVGPWSGRPLDLLISTGDNIDNAQANELQTFLTILAGGSTALSARGSVHEASDELGQGPWPFWCPQPDVADLWKPQGYPTLPDYVARVSASLHSRGLGFPWTSVPGNHDVLRQGTAWPNPAIEAIAVGTNKTLQRPPGFAPADPLSLFVDAPEQFSAGATRQIPPDPQRRAVDLRGWLAAHVQHGALGLTAAHVQRGCADAVIDTEHVRIILLDTNHPGGDYQGSVGRAQLDWLDAQLAETGRTPGRLALLATHHGADTLINHRGDDPQRLHTEALLQVLHRHPCLVAWLGGHRHVHRVQAHPGPVPGVGGFWEITTASLIDWPAQTRTLELLRHADGSIEIVCTLQDHQAPQGNLAALHHTLAQQFAGPQAAHMQGRPGDGSVRLLRAAAPTPATA